MTFGILMTVVVVAVVLTGLYQLLNAVWILRVGTAKGSFLWRAMLGFGLLAVAFLVPYILMFTASRITYSAPAHFVTGSSTPTTQTSP